MARLHGPIQTSTSEVSNGIDENTNPGTPSASTSVERNYSLRTVVRHAYAQAGALLVCFPEFFVRQPTSVYIPNRHGATAWAARTTYELQIYRTFQRRDDNRTHRQGPAANPDPMLVSADGGPCPVTA